MCKVYVGRYCQWLWRAAFIVAALFLHILSVSASGRFPVKFRSLTAVDGLSSYEVTCIYQDSRGFIFFQKEYEDESQLNYQVSLDDVNEQIGKYIPGPLDSTWMALDMKTPMSAANYQYEGKHYAMLVRGLWQVENDYMGGPFVLNVVLDEQRNRILYMMAYVYAPDGEKRNLIRQVESIIFSMNIDFSQENKKEGE